MCLQQVYHFSSKPKRIIDDLSTLTAEGGYEVAKSIDRADFGALNININEFSSLFKNKSQMDVKYLDSLLTAYDGKYEKRNIKSEDFEKTLIGIPVSVLLMSDYTEFNGLIKEELDLYWQKGYARRFIVTFSEPIKKGFERISQDELAKLHQELKSIGVELYDKFLQIPSGAIFVVPTETYDISQDYLEEVTDFSDSLKNPLLKREVESRPYKALRLSSIIAALNHPTDLKIYPEDLLQGISIVEYLSQDFKRFIEYHPKVDDVHDKIFEYLKKNIGTTFTKGQLTTRGTEFGMGRDKLAKNFRNIMEIVSELAEINGYQLLEKQNIRKNGFTYTLLKHDVIELSESVKSLENIVDSVELSKHSNDVGCLEATVDNNLLNLPNIPKNEFLF